MGMTAEQAFQQAYALCKEYVKQTLLENGASYALAEEVASDLELSIDRKTYVMSLSLKNKSGNVLSTKTIDFPIESMVIGADYEDGKIKLTLRNGNTMEADISEIVSGLVKDSFTIAGIDMKDNISASELITALGINNKVDKEAGKKLSTNDYTTAEKEKLKGIDDNANNYVLPAATSNALGGVKSGTDITVDTAGNVSVNDNSHKHVIGNVDNLQDTLDGKLEVNGDTKGNKTTFTQSQSRENIVTGETHATIFGKIAKFFADLNKVAFSGNYNDLSNKPAIPPAVSVKGGNETNYRTGQVNLTPNNIGAVQYTVNNQGLSDTGKANARKNIGAVGYDTNNQGLTDIEKENARTNIGAGTSNFSGNYNDLSNRPTIPTIPTALRNPNALKFTGGVDVTYDGSSAKTVNIPTSLPASDVSSWAKDSSKPSYSWSEITNKPESLFSTSVSNRITVDIVGSTTKAEFLKNSKIAYINFDATFSSEIKTNNGWVDVLTNLTIPDGYRPPLQTYIPCFWGGTWFGNLGTFGHNSGLLMLSPSGNISVLSSAVTINRIACKSYYFIS